MLTIPPLHDAPLTQAERLAVLDRLDEILELRYRSAGLGNFEDPLEEAVYIILSRQTREAAYQRAHRALRKRWPAWRSMLKAPVDEVADVIRPAGFGSQRAAQLQGLLGAVSTACEARGVRRLTLDWLRDLDDREVEDFLAGLPGIGPKSVRCVMHYSLDREALAVDTHVSRVLDRLGVVPRRAGKVKHEDYEQAVPVRYRQRLHVNLIHHGRALCRSSSPKCGECPLISFCPTGREAASTRPSEVPTAVELFAGGGGLGEGFARAGYHVTVAVELDRAAAQTYRLNHPGTVVLEADATQITGAHLARLAPAAATPFAIIAGPPCQGYSMAGHRKAGDAKNSLYTAVVELARELQPRFIAIENVPGMRRVEGRSFESTVLDALFDAGYDADAHLLRACDFGVPQLRRRLLFLAQRRELGPAPHPPEVTHCAGERCSAKCGFDSRGQQCEKPATPTVVEALKGLPSLDHGQKAEYVELADGSVLLNGSTMKHAEHVIAKIRNLQPGTGPISYRRLHQDLARTIVAGHRALPVHPFLDRTISVREAARIQGFADEHVFAGSRSQQPLQVANAVPPPLAQAVAEALLFAAEATGSASRAKRRKKATADPPPGRPVYSTATRRPDGTSLTPSVAARVPVDARSVLQR